MCWRGLLTAMQIRYRPYPAPIDITQVDHIRFGSLTIPVNP